MLIRDVALIYKKKQGLYYAISQKQGKIILSHKYFVFEEAISNSYFFVEYEYLEYDYQVMVNQNKVILKVQDMALLAMLSYQSSWYRLILILNFLFDYFLEYLQDVIFFKEFYRFFSVQTVEKKELIEFIFMLFKTLQIISDEEVEKDQDIFFLIKKKYLERAPFLKNYIESIFFQFLL
jgi:hypothetical protein